MSEQDPRQRMQYAQDAPAEGLVEPVDPGIHVGNLTQKLSLDADSGRMTQIGVISR